VLLYRIGLGRLLGQRFLLLEHRGRRSGRLRRVVVEVVRRDPDRDAWIVASAWGERTQWYRNLLAQPEAMVQVGGRRRSALGRHRSWTGLARSCEDRPNCVDDEAGSAVQRSVPPILSSVVLAAMAAASSALPSAARAGGAVIGWGIDRPNVGPVTAIAAGAGPNISSGCAIRAGRGAVICWGDDSSGQATPPPSVDGTTGSASAITTGYEHSCAIQAGSHAVVCWGRDESTQATPPTSVDGTQGAATAIAAGWFHTIAIRAPEPAASLLGATALAALAILTRARRHEPSPFRAGAEAGVSRR